MNQNENENETRNQDHASFETILSRLMVKNEQLDRQLQASLRQMGLTREALQAVAPEILRRRDATRVARVEQQLDQQLQRQAHDTPDTDWERLRRPSVEQLSRTLGVRLIRV